MKTRKLYENPEAMKFAIDAKKKGHSYKTISTDLETLYNVKLDQSTVYDSLKAYGDKIELIQEQNIVLRENIIENAVDTQRQLTDINQLIWDLMKEEVDKKVKCPECNSRITVKVNDPVYKLKAIDLLLKQLKTNNDIFGVEKKTITRQQARKPMDIGEAVEEQFQKKLKEEN